MYYAHVTAPAIGGELKLIFYHVQDLTFIETYKAVKLVELALIQSKPVSLADARTWNYFRPYIVNNSAEFMVGEFNATIPGTSRNYTAACFEVYFAPNQSVGFCTFKYLLGKQAIGDKDETGAMSLRCLAFLNIIVEQKKIEETAKNEEASHASRIYAPSSQVEKNLRTSHLILQPPSLVIFVDLISLPCDPPVR